MGGMSNDVKPDKTTEALLKAYNYSITKFLINTTCLTKT